MREIRSPKELRSRILTSITEEERRRARIYLLVSGIVAPLSMVGVVASVQYLLSALSQSGFYQYWSLLFSDTDVAVTYWREFGMMLAQTIPLLEATAILIAVAALLVSVQMFVINMRHLSLPSFSNA